MIRHASRLALAALGVGVFGSGCVYVQPPRVEVARDTEQSAEQILGTYLLLSALGGGAKGADSLATLAAIYPPRAQLVTHAVIGFHRERGAWPTTADELRAYAESSPANPRLPADALDGFVTEVRENGDLAYSTHEDRQRGRQVKITPAYRVTVPVPAALFASPDARELPPATGGSTLNIDWAELFPTTRPATTPPASPATP